MTSGIEQLDNVISDLKAKRKVNPVTIRSFLQWFGVQRRTSANVEYINRILDESNIRTDPDYLNIWVDTPIIFKLDDTKQKSSPDSSGSASDTNTHPDSNDPSFKIGKIPAANNKPTSINPNASLLEATTLMMTRNYSQLPVMTSDREVKGVISWESIGIRVANGKTAMDVKSYMDEHYEISSNASLFVAIKTIVERNYVLIRSPEKIISGIVTSSDIALQFEDISTPFLLIGEIENSIRIILSTKITIEDIKKTIKEEHLPNNFSDISELTFGNYVKILENKDNWEKISLKLDRATFCSELSEINAIRNDVMHFDPDPIKEENIQKLRNISNMLDKLRSIEAL